MSHVFTEVRNVGESVFEARQAQDRLRVELESKTRECDQLRHQVALAFELSRRWALTDYGSAVALCNAAAPC